MQLKDARVHFVGVGGVGMSALAQLYHSMGAQVSGSDMRESSTLRDLASKGLNVSVGHRKENVDSAFDVVVYSSAIQPTNPERVEARRLGLPLIPRAEALAEIMRFKRGIAVGGTHGKTSTTSMISSIFMHSQFDPTIAVGGRLKLIESTARLGQGPWMVAEADESDGSFVRYQPEIAIITNIDTDHLDHYGSFQKLQEAFVHFANNIPFYGRVVIYGDDPKIRHLFENFSKKIIYYGLNENNDYRLQPHKSGVYEILQGKIQVGEFQLQVPGVHNALNALAAAVATHLAGVSWSECLQGLNAYSGVDRRFQKMGLCSQATVFDDYAHHPTEIAATVAAAREICGQGQLHIVYQPHRYSRTRDCWQDYHNCFQGVDQLHLLDIYPAGEEPLADVSSEKLAASLGPQVRYHKTFQAVTDHLKSQLQPGDIILTMGAGDISQLAYSLVDEALGES